MVEVQAAISLTSQKKSTIELEPMSDPPFFIRLGENDTENQLDLVTLPLEVFNHQVGLFGWNVIKEASKLNEVLASKVIRFVDQLFESDEWHFAPGLHLLIGTYTT